jgi:hypothetical protein
MTSRSEAAALLGCKESEVVDVADTLDGLVITTVDGAELIKVPEDAPDREGKTGLMLLAVPVVLDAEGRPRPGTRLDQGRTVHMSSGFPVFVARPVDPEEADGADDQADGHEAEADVEHATEVTGAPARRKKNADA